MTIRRDLNKRPKWPYPKETTLTPASNGQWSKKFGGKRYHFGPWADPDTALSRWRREWPLITTGQPVEVLTPTRFATIREMCNVFLDVKISQAEAGELSHSTYTKYRKYAKIVCDVLGRPTPLSQLTPMSFMPLREAANRHDSIHVRSDFIVFVRSLFQWAQDTEMMAPVRFPPELRPPSARVKRAYREKTKRRPWTAPEVRRLLAFCQSPHLVEKNQGINGRVLAAAIYMGINGGYGGADLAEVTATHVDFDGMIIDHLRAKTAMRRKVPLWPETIRAIRRAMRPGEPLIFVNSRCLPLVHGNTNTLAHWFADLLAVAGLTDTGLRFYDLRRTFATIAADSHDKDARKMIMGHSLSEVHDSYVLQFPRHRLDVVAGQVRQWFRNGRMETDAQAPNKSRRLKARGRA